MSEWTVEQVKLYERFVKARNAVGIGSYWRAHTKNWVPCSDVLAVLDVAGQNHPVYVQNDAWEEYKQASMAWWAVEPEFRKTERMSMIRGDYGDEDNWKEKQTRVKEL